MHVTQEIECLLHQEVGIRVVPQKFQAFVPMFRGKGLF